MGRLPMYGTQTYYNTYHYVSDVAPQQAAGFLNQYFLSLIHIWTR